MNSNALLKILPYLWLIWDVSDGEVHIFTGGVSLFIMVSHGGLSVQVLTMLQEACFMQLL